MKLFRLIMQKIENYENRNSENKMRFKDEINDIFVRFVEIPLAGMRKDAKDTFKPYKPGQRRRDLIGQPFYGLGNILFGLETITITPVVTVGQLLKFTIKFCLIPFLLPFYGKEYASDTFKILAKDLGFFFFQVAVVSPVVIFRGATQILAWPFTILRNIVRTSNKAPLIEESKGLQNIINQYNDEKRKNKLAPLRVEAYAYMLLRKFFHARVKQQNTNINKFEITNLIKGFDLHSIMGKLGYQSFTAPDDGAMLKFYGYEEKSSTTETNESTTEKQDQINRETEGQVNKLFQFFQQKINAVSPDAVKSYESPTNDISS